MSYLRENSQNNIPVTKPTVQAERDDVTGAYNVPITRALQGEVIPANTVPASVDAKNRAWRTFIPNILFDVLLFISPILYDAFTSADFAFTKTYWVAIGVSCARTAGVVIFSYVMRMRKPPVGATQ